MFVAFLFPLCDSFVILIKTPLNNTFTTAQTQKIYFFYTKLMLCYSSFLKIFRDWCFYFVFIFGICFCSSLVFHRSLEILLFFFFSSSYSLFRVFCDRLHNARRSCQLAYGYWFKNCCWNSSKRFSRFQFKRTQTPKTYTIRLCIG